MLSRVENELPSQTNSGTSAGEYFRRFWLPALLPSEVPTPDCPPVRVRLLGEDLVAFRDTNGQVGLLEEAFPHRRASLFWGRNEECGLRCVYHGWKFDVNGICVDIPNEPQEYRFENKVRTVAYPTREYGGLVWVYMGPPEHQPELPKLEWARVPESHRYISKRLQETNYLQAIEGGIDSSEERLGETLLDEMRRVQRTAWELLAKTESEGDHRGSIVALREVRECLKSLGEMLAKVETANGGSAQDEHFDCSVLSDDELSALEVLFAKAQGRTRS